MMPSNSKQRDDYYPQAKRAKTTKNVFYCYNCKQEFQPIRNNGHKFCAKCTEDRPIVNRVAGVDCNYPGKTKVSVAPMYRSGPSSINDQSKFSPGKDKKKEGNSSVYWSKWNPKLIDKQSKSVPEYQPSISSVAVVPKSSSLVADVIEKKILETNQQPKNGLTKLKEITVVIDQVKEENLSSNVTSESKTKTNNHASSPTAKDRRTSGILLAEIDLSTSSGDESNNDENKQGTLTCMENDTSSQATNFIKKTDDSCSESHLLPKQQPPISSHPTLLLKSKEKSMERQDNSGLSIQDVAPVLSNQKIDFSQLELDELRGKEEELKQMISSRTQDYDEISSLKKRIIELESQYSAEKEILLSKEGVRKSYELEVHQARSLVETVAGTKDWVCKKITEHSADLEEARSSCESSEKRFGEFKRKLEDAKDKQRRDYLLPILAKQEEEVKDAEKKVKDAVSQLEEDKNELNQSEEVLRTNEAVHREKMVQWERVKSELVELRDIHASTDQEIKLAKSQLESLRQVNNQESVIKHFECKSQLVEIQHKIEALEHEEKLESQRKEFKRLHEIKFDVIRKELDAERESTIQLLS